LRAKVLVGAILLGTLGAFLLETFVGAYFGDEEAVA